MLVQVPYCTSYSSAISSILNPAAAAPPQAPRSYLTVNPSPHDTTIPSTPQRQAVPQPSSQPLNGASYASPTTYQPLSMQTSERRSTAETSALSQPQPSDRSRRTSVPVQQSPRNTLPLSPASQAQPKPPPRQSMEYYQPSQTTPHSRFTSSKSTATLSTTSSRGPPSVISASASSRPPSQQSTTPSSPAIGSVTPQPTIVYKPASGGSVPWVPPGAARPQNVYERRF